ncbi:hypothetical protein PSI23_19410 [Xenorhabdus sp. XENO-10]|uniref:Uncharacterized protein n=1 Tax=Xenorhabdus yunnanensis TaxID=3025878 RepID=A0ABT5LJV3_9GAMM|nr:hypothetical protein [Xenorhabdus yunnanensis]MDC9591392.1 hypothetical protein [Xenorhabdus yunnanensis]
MKKLFVIILTIFYAIFVPLSQANEIVKYPQQDQQNKTTERKKRSVVTLPLKVCKRIAYCRAKVAKKILEIAAKVGIVGIAAQGIANNISQKDFDHLITLFMIGNDEVTQRYLNHLQDKYGSGKSVKPNIGKGLTADQKAKLGGASSGTPEGWEPQNEKNTRKFDRFRKKDLISSANKPINNQGLSAVARAWDKHAGRLGGTFKPLKGNITQKNAAAEQFVRSVLNNPNTVRNKLARGGFEYRLPNGKGIRFNADGSFNTVLDPKVMK